MKRFGHLSASSSRGQSGPGSAMEASNVALGRWGGLLCFVPFPAGPPCRARLDLVINSSVEHSELEVFIDLSQMATLAPPAPPNRVSDF